MTEKYIVTVQEYHHAAETWQAANPSSDGGDDNWVGWWKWIQMQGNYAVHEDKDLVTVPKISYRRIKVLNSPHYKALLKAMEIQDANP